MSSVPVLAINTKKPGPTIHPMVVLVSMVYCARVRPPLEMPKLTAIFDEVFGGVEIKSVGSVGAKVVQILEGNADLYVHTTGFY